MAKKKTSKKKSKIPSSTKMIIPTKKQREEIVDMASKGWPLDKISMAQGWSQNTLYNILKRDPDLAREIKGSRFRATHKVVNALFERATGYEHPETKFVSVSQGMHRGSIVEQFETTKRYPPDYNSARLYLMNTAPDMFQDEKTITVDMNKYSDEEIMAMALEIMEEDEEEGIED